MAWRASASAGLSKSGRRAGGAEGGNGKGKYKGGQQGEGFHVDILAQNSPIETAFGARARPRALCYDIAMGTAPAWPTALFSDARGRSFPGTRPSPGRRSRFGIRRDRWAVPHIEAAGERDAWFGLGFCFSEARTGPSNWNSHAGGPGTLSEFRDGEGLIIDRLCRRIGFSRAAKAQLSVLIPPSAPIRGLRGRCHLGRTAGLPASSSDFQLRASRPRRSFPKTAFGDGADVLLPGFNWDAELMRPQGAGSRRLGEALAALGEAIRTICRSPFPGRPWPGGP